MKFKAARFAGGDALFTLGYMERLSRIFPESRKHNDAAECTFRSAYMGSA